MADNSTETFEKLQALGANYGECWMITWITNFPFVVSLPFSENFLYFSPPKIPNTSVDQ